MRLEREKNNLLYRDVKFAVRMLQAIFHPFHRVMIKLLDEKRALSVTDIYHELGSTQSETSLHLAIMRSANIVIATRESRNVYYSLNYQQIEKVVISLPEILNNGNEVIDDTIKEIGS